ncbi:TPA: hypothetical protein DCE37_14995 [Candidatus Latescibacteria bacterium]|nr:hypothetical protein [Candidatus Latescibacterota bacterium]
MSEQLLNPNLIHVAGWTLVHFPWQACLIGLLVGAAGRLLKNHEASWRYGVACAALLAVVLSAVTTVVLLSVHIGPLTPFNFSVSWIESKLPWVYAGWLLGVVGLSLRLAGGWFLVYRLKRLAEPVRVDLQLRVDDQL